MPGDPLYSTKLAFENVRLAMAQDPAKAVDLHVEFSHRRISELGELTEHGLPDQAAIAPVLSSLQAHQDEAIQGVDTLKQKGKPVGVIGEWVAVTLQQNTAELMTIRSDTGCNPDGSDPRCQVIATAVGVAEQALAKVGEEPGMAANPSVLAAPLPARPGSSRGSGSGQLKIGGQLDIEGEQQPLEPSSGKGMVPVPPPRVTVSPGPPPVKTPVEAPPGGEFVPVAIDIKPFDNSNTIDVVNRTDLPVVVKATPSFDPSTLDIDTICFGHDPSDPAKSDCNAQGRLFGLPGGSRKDLILVFRMNETGIRPGDEDACLTGRTKDGKTMVKGCNKVSAFPITAFAIPSS